MDYTPAKQGRWTGKWNNYTRSSLLMCRSFTFTTTPPSPDRCILGIYNCHHNRKRTKTSANMSAFKTNTWSRLSITELVRQQLVVLVRYRGLAVARATCTNSMFHGEPAQRARPTLTSVHRTFSLTAATSISGTDGWTERQTSLHSAGFRSKNEDKES